MPFFSRHEEPEPAPEPVPVEEPRRKHSLFGRARSPSPSPSHRTSTTTMSTRSSGTYHTTHTEGGPVGGSVTGSRRSVLSRFGGHGNNPEMDPSIVAARERVLSAENAEREADRALMGARRAVQEARDQVRRLEEEAKEEARRAKIKQYHAREVSKRGKALGRHGEL